MNTCTGTIQVEAEMLISAGIATKQVEAIFKTFSVVGLKFSLADR